MESSGSQEADSAGASFQSGLTACAAEYAREYGHHPTMRLSTRSGDSFLVRSSHPGPHPDMLGLTVYDVTWVDVPDAALMVRSEARVETVSVDGLHLPVRRIFVRVDDIVMVEFLHEAPAPPSRYRWHRRLSGRVGLPGFASLEYKSAE